MTMTPQPMSDAEIAGMLEKHAGGCEWSDDEYESAEALVATAMAARDAQWVAMLGEPVAHIDTASIDALAKLSPRGYMTTNIYRVGVEHSSPLYAIKETP